MKVIIVIHYSCLVTMEEYVYTHVLDLFGCSYFGIVTIILCLYKFNRNFNIRGYFRQGSKEQGPMKLSIPNG